MANSLLIALLGVVGAITIIANAGVYILIKRSEDPDPILLPTDADADPGRYAWEAVVKYGETGNRETFIIRDQDELSKYEARQAIEDQIHDAEVIILNQHRMYDFGPGATDQDG